jgi:glycosyltransferase involved in cell wall biosynthesis
VKEKGRGIGRPFRIPDVGNPAIAALGFGWPTPADFARVWTPWKPDLVQVESEGFLGVRALRAAVRLGLPITTSHQLFSPLYGRNYRTDVFGKLRRGYLRWFHNQATATFAPTRQACDQLKAAGIRRCRVLGRGVDCDLFSPLRRDRLLRQAWGAYERTVVLFVGRLTWEKDITLGVRAFREIQSLDATASFVVVGDGPLRARLQEQNPDFHFCGAFSGDALAAHYAFSDLFLSPSLTESFSTAVPVAMASGLPVVAFDDAVARDRIRHGVSGCLAGFGDEEAFLAETRALMRGRGSWTLMGAAARAAASGFDWSRVLARWEADLLECAASFRPARVRDPIAGAAKSLPL